MFIFLIPRRSKASFTQTRNVRKTWKQSQINAFMAHYQFLAYANAKAETNEIESNGEGGRERVHLIWWVFRLGRLLNNTKVLFQFFIVCGCSKKNPHTPLLLSHAHTSNQCTQTSMPRDTIFWVNRHPNEWFAHNEPGPVLFWTGFTVCFCSLEIRVDSMFKQSEYVFLKFLYNQKNQAGPKRKDTHSV